MPKYTARQALVSQYARLLPAVRPSKSSFSSNTEHFIANRQFASQAFILNAREIAIFNAKPENLRPDFFPCISNIQLSHVFYMDT